MYQMVVGPGRPGRNTTQQLSIQTLGPRPIPYITYGDTLKFKVRQVNSNGLVVYSPASSSLNTDVNLDTSLPNVSGVTVTTTSLGAPEITFSVPSGYSTVQAEEQSPDSPDPGWAIYPTTVASGSGYITSFLSFPTTNVQFRVVNGSGQHSSWSSSSSVSSGNPIPLPTGVSVTESSAGGSVYTITWSANQDITWP